LLKFCSIIRLADFHVARNRAFVWMSAEIDGELIKQIENFRFLLISRP